MSASLVGSEMCIRDSNRASAVSCVFLHSMGDTATWRPLSSLGKFSPVSYTHLTLPTICSV
eukprot:6050131-Alexandrium_andersonii.AAC.1